MASAMIGTLKPLQTYLSLLVLHDRTLWLSPHDLSLDCRVFQGQEQVVPASPDTGSHRPMALDFDTAGLESAGFSLIHDGRGDAQSPLRLGVKPGVGDVALTRSFRLPPQHPAGFLQFHAALHNTAAAFSLQWQRDQRTPPHEIGCRDLDHPVHDQPRGQNTQPIRLPIDDRYAGGLLTLVLKVKAKAGGATEGSAVFVSRPIVLAGSAPPALLIASDAFSNESSPLKSFLLTTANDPVCLHIGAEILQIAPPAANKIRIVPAQGSADPPRGLAGQTRWKGGGYGRPLPRTRGSAAVRIEPDTSPPPGHAPLEAAAQPAVIHSAPSPEIAPAVIAGNPRHADAARIDALFDAEFYGLAFPADRRPADPASHYLSEGWQQGRDPAPWFSTWHYLAMHPDVADAGINPFLHYCIAGHLERRALPPLGRDRQKDVYVAHAFAVAPGPEFEDFDPTIGVGRRKRAKVLAYYLPQFHPSEVNDKQWGAGFTEWRQLARAMPRFAGHIQPRIPRDLGFYSLAEGEAMRRQIAMAKAAGLFGFCFYHYWFDGQRVLDAPMERFLADPTLEFPFCLMWANENWTRTWDGSDTEVILRQSYREADDSAFVDDLARHMKDPRYIRIANRPLVFIYRPAQIPNARATLRKWRELLKQRRGLDPIIMMAQGFNDIDPRPYDLDGAIEFPPHKVCEGQPPINAQLDVLDTAYTGHILSYDTMVDRARSEPPADFPLIRTVTPTWDNEARRPGRGMILHGSTPAKFGAWVDQMLTDAEANPVFDEAFLCVNAWNEWAEGAVLEPDVHYGGAYLNALSRAIHKPSAAADRTVSKLVIVGHDAHANGAQLLALNIGQRLKSQFGVTIAFVLGDEGPLLDRYRAIAPVSVAKPRTPEADAVFARLAAEGFDRAITNTTPSGQFVPALKAEGFTVLSLVHELPNLLRSCALGDAAQDIAAQSDRVIFPADVVRSGFEAFAGPVANKAEVLPQGLYNTDVLNGDGTSLRAELGLPRDIKIVLGVGYADLRKGIDRFVSAALSLCCSQDDVAFLWVGAPAGEAVHWFQPEIEASGLGARIRFLGQRDDVARFFAAADVFYLASREDPFPSVVLEALASGLPVIGHAGCGGCDALIARHGTLVTQSDPMAATAAIRKAMQRKSPKAAAARRAEICNNHDFDSYLFGLLQRLDPGLVSVSAVVPNYQYERYVGERLRSVFDQTYPLREVIVLDDASPDDSLTAIRHTAAAARRTIALHVNDRNSGSPFAQWRRGLELAKGDYVWIAEADDLADPSFVARLIAQMRRAGSVLGFTDSRQIDETGAALGDSYRPYVNQIEPGAFDTAFDMDGPVFLARYLAVKNVILNVSGVIAHRASLLEAFDRVGDDLRHYKVAGDWRLYAEICTGPDSRISYLPEPLNTHRRHRVSVTHALKVEVHLAEIAGMQRRIRDATNVSPETIARQDEAFEAAKSHLRAGLSPVRSPDERTGQKYSQAIVDTNGGREQADCAVSKCGE